MNFSFYCNFKFIWNLYFNEFLPAKLLKRANDNVFVK